MSTQNQTKYAWITGASRGIGYSTAERFLESGWNVVVLTRNTDSLQSLKSTYKDTLHTYAVDLVHLNTADLPTHPVDVLINNAGAILNKPFNEIEKHELEKVYQVNVFGPLQLIQLLMGQFRSTAHIINISSVGGVQGSVKFPGLSAYSSSKGALTILTECLQAEFTETDLAFNCLALGAVNTDMLIEAFPGYSAPVNPGQMSSYIYDFACGAHLVMRGKTIEVSLSTP